MPNVTEARCSFTVVFLSLLLSGFCPIPTSCRGNAVLGWFTNVKMFIKYFAQLFKICISLCCSVFTVYGLCFATPWHVLLRYLLKLYWNSCSEGAFCGLCALTNYADEEKEPQVGWFLYGGGAGRWTSDWWRSRATDEKPADGIPEGEAAVPSASLWHFWSTHAPQLQLSFSTVWHFLPAVLAARRQCCTCVCHDGRVAAHHNVCSTFASVACSCT